MSNNFRRKPDYTPIVYTRYFERTSASENRPNHLHFDDESATTSSNYQTKRDLIFRRLFPSKYADTNQDESNNVNGGSITINGTGATTNNAAQSLGDFIPLSNIGSNSTLKKKSPSESDTETRSSSSEDSFIESDDDQIRLPTIKHESIVGNVHPRSTIENVRSILIRELYERTSDSGTEWLKCKMGLPREHINPKYYADFQRRYRHQLQQNSIKKKKNKSKTIYIENGQRPLESIRNTSSDDVIEIVSETKTTSKPPQYITLDTDDDVSVSSDSDQRNPTYFVDRSSNRARASSPTMHEDYVKEDSKYAQLPSKTTTSSSTQSSTVIRPIISKHQRKKKNKTPCSAIDEKKEPSTPLISAIGRIIDHMDKIDRPRSLPETTEEHNLIIKTLKKRKKKTKKKSKITTTATS